MGTAFLSSEALNLLASLAVGFVIGIERGWSQRQRSDGSRVAGLRTFTLVGLLGGILALVPDGADRWALPAALLGLCLLLAVAFHETSRVTSNFSITTAVALPLTLFLGVTAMHGHIAVALAAAVVAAALLDLKSTLHRWLRLLEHRELAAALQMLVLSVVVLPNVPNYGYGPYDALNPYQLWWAVVLIAGLSLAGHFAMRITGYARGMFLTGVLGGLASSTAATLALARVARKQPKQSMMAVAGALAACGVMFFRIIVLLATIEPALLKVIGVALAVTGMVLLLLGAWHLRNAVGHPVDEGQGAPIEPFDLSTALVFSAYLGLMSVAVPAASEWFGADGVFAVAALSGLLDVDAIVISIAHRHSAADMHTLVALTALCIAICANLISKVCISWVAGGAAIGRTVMTGYAIALLIGATMAVPVLA